jgi:hypothetical protein
MVPNLRTEAAYGVGLLVTAVGVLVVEPLAAAGKAMGQGELWVYEEVTDFYGYEASDGLKKAVHGLAGVIGP